MALKLAAKKGTEAERFLRRVVGLNEVQAAFLYHTANYCGPRLLKANYKALSKSGFTAEEIRSDDLITELGNPVLHANLEFLRLKGVSRNGITACPCLLSSKPGMLEEAWKTWPPSGKPTVEFLFKLGDHMLPINGPRMVYTDTEMAALNLKLRK